MNNVIQFDAAAAARRTAPRRRAAWMKPAGQATSTTTTTSSASTSPGPSAWLILGLVGAGLIAVEVWRASTSGGRRRIRQRRRSA